MTRITRAAKTLVAQILERYEDADIQNGPEADGLGVHRQLIVAAPVAEPLFDLLLPIAMHDGRIESLNIRSDGKDLIITFSPDRFADEAHPFPLAEVEAVQKGDEADEVAASGPDAPPVGEQAREPVKPAKKAAAKKADS